MKKQIFPKLVSLVFAVLVICFAVGFYIFAWTSPGGDPPTGNVDTPLNVSDTAQYKLGPLGIGGVFRTDSETVLAVLGGDVGIGTQNPSTELHVEGNVRITGLNNCDTINTDANGNFTCGEDAIGGGVSGSGTNDKIPKWSGGTTLTDSIISEGQTAEGDKFAYIAGTLIIGDRMVTAEDFTVYGTLSVQTLIRGTGNICSSFDGDRVCLDDAAIIGGGVGDGYILQLSGGNTLVNSKIRESGGRLIIDDELTVNRSLYVAGLIEAEGDICTDQGGGVCLGDLGGGGVSGGGTSGRIPKWSGGTTLTNSIMSQSGTLVTINGHLGVNNTLVVNSSFLAMLDAGIFGDLQVGGDLRVDEEIEAGGYNSADGNSGISTTSVAQRFLKVIKLTLVDNVLPKSNIL